MDNIDINSIVKIEQMPKVFSQLELIGKFIDEKIKDIDILECTEENKNEVKKRRTEINNTLKLLDDKRKEIKNTLLEPYEIFNEKYEQECKDKLLSASEILKTKIDVIEEKQKKEKEKELREFVKQHCDSRKIHIEFETIGLNITLNASIKSLKEQALTFIEKVDSDLKLIALEEYGDEILIEYNKNYDFTQSKLDVMARHKQLEEIQNQKKEIQLQIDDDAKIVEKVEEITTPKEIIEDSKIMTVTFTLKDTKENIIKVREFMKEEGINYE